MARIRISLSTAIKLMFVGALLSWMNTQPVLYFDGYSNTSPIGTEVYSQKGYGWPTVVSTNLNQNKSSYQHERVFVNILFATLILILSGVLFESSFRHKWMAFFIAGGAGIFVYLACLLAGSGPVISDVSLSRAFKPMSQSWREGAIAFVLVWSITTPVCILLGKKAEMDFVPGSERQI